MDPYSRSWTTSTGRLNGRRGTTAKSSRCTFKYFTSAGIFLVCAIIMMSLPSRSFCRPVNSEYGYTTVDGSREGEFEFQRRIPISLRNANDTGGVVDSVDVNSGSPFPNSSMIVHVIVSSSSSTSSSETETDSEILEIPEESFQYTIAEEEGELEGNNNNNNNNNSSNIITTPKSFVTTTLVEDFRSTGPPKGSPPQLEDTPQSQDTFTPQEDQLELKKIAKSQTEPVQDIFSAFYRAFSQPSSSSTPEDVERSSSLPVFSTDEPISTFMIRPQRRRQFNLEQTRRRFRNRQREQQGSRGGDMIMMLMGNPDGPAPTSEQDSKLNAAEETAKKLEMLAKKIDKSDGGSFRGQYDKIQNSEEVPLPASPSKVAVSVAVTHSRSVVGNGKKRTSFLGDSPTTLWENKTEDTVHHDKVRPRAGSSQSHSGAKKNAKSESGFLAEEIHGSSPLLRSRPLIKSLPRNGAHYDGNRSEHNVSHNFLKNFSITTGRSEQRAEESVRESRIEDRISFRIGERTNVISIGKEVQSRDKLDTFHSSNPKAESSTFIEITTSRPPPRSQRRKITRTASRDIGDPSTANSETGSSFLSNFKTNQKPAPTSAAPPVESTTPRLINWQQPEKVWSEPAQVWGVPAKVWSEPAKVWSEPAKVWSEAEKVWGEPPKQQEPVRPLEEMMQSDQPPEDRTPSEGEEDDPPPQGTFVILGDDENEEDSIDGDLGRPLMLHHFPVPPPSTEVKPKETVITSSSISTSISTSSSSSSSTRTSNTRGSIGSEPFSSKVVFKSQHHGSQPPTTSHIGHNNNSSITNDNVNVSNNPNSSENSSAGGGDQQKKSGKKFGYVIEGANVRKYRVEERTPDGYIVGEYGVLNNQNAFLRGVRYTADGTINPRLIHEALMKFLSLRRR